MVETYGPTLETAHGKASNGPVHAVGQGTVAGVDHRDYLLGDDPVEWGEVHYHAAGPSGLELRLVGQGGFATVHHDQHRLAFAGGDEVVHDVVHLALDGPAGLVLTASVEEVENRVVLGRIALIFSWDIDIADPPGLREIGVVALHADLAMRDFLLQVIVYAGLRYLNAAGHHSAAIEKLAGRVCDLDSVDMYEIVVETRDLGIACDLPHAVGVLGHGIELPEIQLNGLGVGSDDLESRTEVGIDHRILLAVEVGRGRSRLRDLCG